MVLVYVAKETTLPGMYVAELPDHPGCTAYAATVGVAVERAIELLEVQGDAAVVERELGHGWRLHPMGPRRMRELRRMRRPTAWERVRAVAEHALAWWRR